MKCGTHSAKVRANASAMLAPVNVLGTSVRYVTPRKTEM
jgi:hypothetical protein